MDSVSGLTNSPKAPEGQSKATLPRSDQNYGVIQPKGFPGLPEGWISEWETFPAADGLVRLFGVLQQPEKKKIESGNAHRALVIVHGLGEHCGRYLHFPHYLQGHFGCFYSYDHRGHGRSEGLRGHVDRFELFSEDLKLVIRRLDEKLRARHGKAEIHLFAHSMGGLIALEACFSDAKLPIRSLSVSAPLLGIKVAVPVVKKVAAVTLSRLWGSLQLASEVNPKDLSHDPEVAAAYVADRLVHNKVTPRLFTEMTAAMERMSQHESGLEYPILMQIPEEDRVTDSESAIRFFRGLKMRDKSLKTYPGFFHESFNEVGRSAPFEDLQAWIRQHQES